jgi:hypothetical protein
MMREATMSALLDSIGKRGPAVDSADKPAKKRRIGNAAVPTGKGQNGIIARHQTSGRDERGSSAALERKKSRLNIERKSIDTALRELEKHKGSSATANPPNNYWTVSQSSSDETLKLFLRLFQPNCGKLSKSKTEKWDVVQRKVLPMLTMAAVDAKEQELTRRLATIADELKSMVENVDMESEELSPMEEVTASSDGASGGLRAEGEQGDLET